MTGLYRKKKNTFFSAAVLFKKNKIKILKLKIPILKKGQVLIKNLFSGICHTQKLEYFGKRGKDRFYPHCFGHESVAKVISVGAGVKKIKKGDLVISSWIKGKGIAANTAQYFTENNLKINSGPIAVFSELSIVSENRLYKKPNSITNEYAALFGCAIPTGMGCVKNLSNLNNKSKVCIIGAGGIGTFSILATYFSKTKNIFVIDNNKKKLSIAKKLNLKNHLNKSKKLEIDKILKKNNNNLFDVVIECTGNPQVMSECLKLIKNLSGKIVINGNADYGSRLSIDPLVFNQGKTIIGSFGGSSNLDNDLNYYAKIFNKIPLKIKKKFIKEYSLKNLEKAFYDMNNKSEAIRGIIKF